LISGTVRLSHSIKDFVEGETLSYIQTWKLHNA